MGTRIGWRSLLPQNTSPLLSSVITFLLLDWVKVSFTSKYFYSSVSPSTFFSFFVSFLFLVIDHLVSLKWLRARNHIFKTPNILNKRKKFLKMRVGWLGIGSCKSHTSPTFVSTDFCLFRITRSLGTARWMESRWSPLRQVQKKWQKLKVETKLCSAPRFSCGRQPCGYHWLPGFNSQFQS